MKKHSSQYKGVCMPLFPDPMLLESSLRDKKYLPDCFSHQSSDWFISAQFLINYKYAYETYKSYRRDVERFLLWLWCEKNVSLAEVNVQLVQQYIDFVRNAPEAWVMQCHQRRYVDEELAYVNTQWRPFIRPSGTISVNIKSLLAILSTYFNYLVDHDYVAKNPLKQLKQKKHLTVHSANGRVIRKLSALQWDRVIASCGDLKATDETEMRNWWMLGLFYLLGLRISEVSVTTRHAPSRSDFWRDDQGLWWFKVLGKANKFREVAVPDVLIGMLKTYRASLGLPEHMRVKENAPLLVKHKGQGGLGVRQVRLCVERCFARAAMQLRQLGKEADAAHLEQATVHWLRHTSISEAVKFRPIEHVRDDAGHSSITVTDIYIDSDRKERHSSAQGKKLSSATSTHSLSDEEAV